VRRGDGRQHPENSAEKLVRESSLIAPLFFQLHALQHSVFPTPYATTHEGSVRRRDVASYLRVRILNDKLYIAVWDDVILLVMLVGLRAPPA
jgi:hypothetical protein